MRTLRTLLTALVFLSLTTISVGTATIVYWYRLPDPEVADGNALFRWLVTRDVRHESPQTQQKLLRRLEAELRKGIENVDEVKENLDPAREAQLRKNLEWLAQQWFRQRAATFAELPNKERNAFIDDQITQLQKLGDVYQALSSRETDASKSAFSNLKATAELLQKVNDWIAAADAPEQAQMRTFVSAVQTRIFARKFGLGMSKG